MKKLLIFTLAAFVFAGCYNGYTDNKSKSFAQQIAELETQPVPAQGSQDAAPLPGVSQQNDADREMEIAAAAQKERRAEVAPEESNYIFKVKPAQGTYFFDQNNQVLKDEPKKEDYTAKRLWNKPKRIKPEDYDKSKTGASAGDKQDAGASAQPSDSQAASDSSDEDSGDDSSAMAAAGGEDQSDEY